MPCKTSADSHSFTLNLPRGDRKLISGNEPRLLPGSKLDGAAAADVDVDAAPAAAPATAAAGPGAAESWILRASQRALDSLRLCFAVAS